MIGMKDQRNKRGEHELGIGNRFRKVQEHKKAKVSS